VAGWYVTEIGRQPYIVQGLLRTADVVSSTPAPMIALTLAAYVTVYLALIVAYVGVLAHMAGKPIDAPVRYASARPVQAEEARS
jgi:cytochrome bd ubiquinol oxidase subunit I